MTTKPTQFIRLQNREGGDCSLHVVRSECGKWFRIVLDSEQRQIRPGEPLHIAVRWEMAGITRRNWPDYPQYWVDENPVKRDAVVRVWIYWRDSVVRVAVPWNGEIQFGAGGATEEGWSHHQETLSHDANTDTLTRSCMDDGADCDGRYSHTTESSWRRGGAMAPMYEFTDAGDMIEIPGILQPDWNLANRWQCDANAELAGY